VKVAAAEVDGVTGPPGDEPELVVGVGGADARVVVDEGGDTPPPVQPTSIATTTSGTSQRTARCYRDRSGRP
jgi:hypothetical protein